jgi:hypothetical protein
MGASGSETITWSGRVTNHSCAVSVAGASAKAETVEGLAEGGMGLRLQRKRGRCSRPHVQRHRLPAEGVRGDPRRRDRYRDSERGTGRRGREGGVRQLDGRADGGGQTPRFEAIKAKTGTRWS